MAFKSKSQTFESMEYQFIDTKDSQTFFNKKDSNLYQIKTNSIQDINSNKGELSLWNLSKEKRISGIYKKSKSKPIYQFDWLGEVYYLEIFEHGVLIQFLYLKESFKPAFNGKKQATIGLW